MKTYFIIVVMVSLWGAVPLAAQCCGSGYCGGYGYGHHYHGGYGYGGGYGYWAPYSRGNPYVQPNVQPSSAPLETLKGTVSEINPASTAAAITDVWLRAAAGTILVRLAPTDFLKQNGIAVHEGDQLTVKGYRVAAAGDDLLVATDLEVGSKKLSLRTGSGRPLW